MNIKDISSDVDITKVPEIKHDDSPKEINENKSDYTDIPKEIGEDENDYIDIPKEIGEDENDYTDIPKEIGEDENDYIDIPKEIGENENDYADMPKGIDENFENAHENSENSDIQKNYYTDAEGNKHYKDDNNEVYRINDNLVENNTYERNGYKYETDENGRIISTEGKLRLKEDDNYRQVKDPMSKIGKGDERKTDDRGHIIGNQFDASNGIENVVAQDSNLNRGEYRNFENNLAKEIRAGKDVRVKITLNYSGKSYRPDSFQVNYSINGEEFVKVFSNESKGAN